MTVAFSESTFFSLSGLPLGEYVDSISASGYQGLDEQTIRALLGRLESMSGVHAIYVLWWAVKFGIPGLGEHAVRLICRSTLSVGERASAFRLACEIPDLKVEHVEFVEKAGLPNTFDVISDNTSELRRRIARRDSRRTNLP
jgi:hypothetical protein